MNASASFIDLSKLADRETWAKFAPRLHIDDQGVLDGAKGIDLDVTRSPLLKDQIRTEGYIHESGIDWGVDLALMVDTVKALSAANLPPVFAFVYDEFWIPFRRLAPMFKLLLGDYAMLPDMWVWDVNPKENGTGWSAHRDKGHVTLAPDRSPNSVTTWIPLTNASPLNSCIYVLPATLDPTYGTEKDHEWRIDLPSIRALPARPGDVMIWTQALLHWGSRSSARADENRVSMAIEFQKSGIRPFREPLFDPKAPLSFETRIALISSQIQQYRHMHASPAYEAVVQSLARAIESKRTGK